MSYANTKEAKLKKRHAMMDEVHRQFTKKSFEEIRMIDIAKGCGVAKGTVFNYYESKEELFLRLLIREYGKWFDGLYQAIGQQGMLSVADLQKRVIDYVDRTVSEDMRIFRLLSIGHSHLEHNVSLRMAEQYRRFINERTRDLGQLITSRNEDISMIQGIKLIMTLHTILVGHIQMATLPEVMVRELALDELEAFEVDFKVSVLDAIKVYMGGLFKK